MSQWTVNIFYFISLASIILYYYSLHMGFYVDYCVIYTDIQWIGLAMRGELGEGWRGWWASVTLSYELICRVQSSGTLSPYQFHGASPINWTGSSSPSIIVQHPLARALDPFKKIHYSKILSARLIRWVYFISHKPAHISWWCSFRK